MNASNDTLPAIHPDFKLPEKRHRAFWNKVNKNGPIPPHRTDLGPCWVWTAHLQNMGYGQFHQFGSGMLSHRISWMICSGSIKKGMCVLHSCDNPACIRPSHLFLGTKAENTADMVRKGRAKRGVDNNQSKLTEAQVREIRAHCVEAKISKRKLAAMYGVTDMVIGMIHRRQRWGHLKD